MTNYVSNFNLLNENIEIKDAFARDNINIIDITKVGGIGDGSYDNTNIIKQHANAFCLYFPEGEYLISDTITLKTRFIIMDANAKIISNTFVKYLFDVNTDNDFTLFGGIFDGKLNACSGVHITKCNNLLIDGTISINFDNKNLPSSESIVGCDGIIVEECYNSIIRNTQVSNVRATKYIDGSQGCFGITTVTHNNSVVENNVIENIYTPNGQTIDSDGIRCFTRENIVSDVRSNGKIIIRNNRVINCANRFVKIQAIYCEIYNNTFINQPTSDMNTSGEKRYIDIQDDCYAIIKSNLIDYKYSNSIISCFPFYFGCNSNIEISNNIIKNPHGGAENHAILFAADWGNTPGNLTLNFYNNDISFYDNTEKTTILRVEGECLKNVNIYNNKLQCYYVVLLESSINSFTVDDYISAVNNILPITTQNRIFPSTYNNPPNIWFENNVLASFIGELNILNYHHLKVYYATNGGSGGITNLKGGLQARYCFISVENGIVTHAPVSTELRNTITMYAIQNE